MNREIKFRGFVKGGTTWKYGTPVFYKDGGACIYNSECPNYGCEATNILKMRTEVFDDSIGQFTGLHARDGKEIYEGDLLAPYGNITLKPNYHEAFEVKWEVCGWNIGAESDTDYYVIGNIYENPNLLN